MNPISAVLVDDDGYARDLLGSILREFGCKVHHALSNGAEAVRKCSKNHPDILFLDIEMPGMDGFSTLEKILLSNPKQYVVMISAHSTLDNVKKAVELGARGFIVKPYTSAKVSDIVEKFRKDSSRNATGQTAIENSKASDRPGPTTVKLGDSATSASSPGKSP
jgi:two-component system chemotaxis response regulator CheY